MQHRTYIAIDLKSFYASVECVDRGWDPMTTNLVVADASRTTKTICLAVSPALKAFGVPGRPRLFEVVQRVKEINCQRLRHAPEHRFTGKSVSSTELESNPALAVDYVTATPRMALYMDYSVRIYHVYLKYVAPEDIHVYSVDEVFMDVTGYLQVYRKTARELAMTMILDVLETTGITATAGIGTNLYLCKVAMDIEAKHIPPDENGVRIAELDEIAYRERLWDHRPLTDFWRIGRGYAEKLESRGLMTMGDVARCSLGGANEYYNENLLYKMFGVNAELLIDHAWGWEPCTIADIKAYRPESSSMGAGQVLLSPYTAQKARLIVHEMTDLLVLDLVEKRMMTDHVVLSVGYDIENLTRPEIAGRYRGPVTTDHYGRKVPQSAHGSANLESYTSSSRLIIEAVLELYDRIVDPHLLVRRIQVTAAHILPEEQAAEKVNYRQMSLFDDEFTGHQMGEWERFAAEREKKLQRTMLDIRKRFGKNAILKGMNLEEGAMTMERNRQIGGHKA